MAKRLRDLYLNRPLYRDTFIYKDISSYTYKGISKKSYEELRVILEKVSNKPVTIEEAKRTGDWLLNFYKHLN